MLTCPKCDMPTEVLETRDERRVRACERGHKFVTQEVFVRDVKKSSRIYHKALPKTVELANPFEAIKRWRAPQ